jgi:hypothetical protein
MSTAYFDGGKGPMTSCSAGKYAPWALASGTGVPAAQPCAAGPGRRGVTSRRSARGAKGEQAGASRRSACPAWPPRLEPELPGAPTAGPQGDTGAQSGGLPGQATQRLPAARGHDQRPVHLRAPLRYSGHEISVAGSSTDIPCRSASPRRRTELSCDTKHRGRPSSSPA